MNLIAQYERVKQELEIARRIQLSLIPSENPECKVAEIATFFKPSVEVGGDFYDFFELDNDRLAMVIGDVSGKGIPAALHMAELKGIFQTLVQFDLEPEEFLYRTNKAVAKCFQKNIFATMIYMVLDRKEQTLTYARAGHSPIMYYNPAVGKASTIEDKGLGVGIVRNDSFKKHIHIYKRRIYTGDVYVMVTDGFEESTVYSGDAPTVRYGCKRLLQSLEMADKSSAVRVKDTMVNDFTERVEDNENTDDLCMMVLRIK